MPMTIAGALFALGAPLGVVNFFAIGFGATLVSAAVSIGISVAASFLFRPGGSAAPSLKPSDGQFTIRQPVPPRWRSYGRVRVSGPAWWLQAEDVNGKLYMGLAINQGRIGGIVSYHIDDNEVTIDGSFQVTTAPYSSVTTKILHRLGLPTETAYAELSADFAVEDVRGDGVATVLGIFDNFVDAATQLENYPNGQPRLRVTMDASVVWDPRDSAQMRTDPSTWQFSENPVVCLLDYMLSADGFALPWARVEGNLQQWKDAADVCDELVFSIGISDYEARYRVAGSYLFTDRPADVVERFRSTFDGRVWQKRDGTVGIIAGKYVPPSVSITDSEVLDFELTRGKDPLFAVAGIKAQYMSPANDYREQDADAWPDGDTVAQLDEDRVINLDLMWVPSHRQARTLMKRRAVREAAPYMGTVTCALSALRAIDQRYVNLSISELDLDTVSFEVDRFTIDFASSEVILEVTQIGPEVDEFNPEIDEGTAPMVPGITWVDKADGTIIGGFGTAIIFDNNRSTGGVSGGLNGFVAKTFSAPKRFYRAVFYGPTNIGFTSNSVFTPTAGNVTLEVRGVNGAAPSAYTDGTLLASVGPFVNTWGPSPVSVQLDSTDTATGWDHLMFVVKATGGVDQVLLNEVDLWELID